MQKGYSTINGFAITKYGYFFLKRCKWCYNTLNNTNEVYCCVDCKEEHDDWSYLQSYKDKIFWQRKYEREKALLNKNLKEKTKTTLEAIEKRKQYLKEYDAKRKEEKKEYYKQNKDRVWNKTESKNA